MRCILHKDHKENSHVISDVSFIAKIGAFAINSLFLKVATAHMPFTVPNKLKFFKNLAKAL